MNKLISLLALGVAVVFLSCNTQERDERQTINPVLGDISFVKKFGYQPDAGVNEDLRIKTHLEYVENLLREKDVSDLSPALLANRKQLLDLLHTYATTAIFPRNYDYTGNREPCFIDKDNRICGVGYLIEKTAGRHIAEDVNSKHKYDRILAMNDQSVDAWIATSGLTKEECAMIQPTYGPPPGYSGNYISPAYGVSSAVVGGFNLSMNTLNGIQISKGANKKTIAILGLVTGAGQTILGASMFPRTTIGVYGNTSNESRKTLSMFNIGLGTTTMILSAWNLITNRTPKPTNVSWNVGSFRTPADNRGVAVTVRRIF